MSLNMNERQKVQYLVVDTSAFIQNAPLQDIAVNVITEQDVVDEVTNKRQLRRLVVLPYDLIIQNTDSENIKFVTEFAKKTGDYISLSATDIKVIALTYQLEKEKVGIDHLRTEPIVTQTKDWRTQKGNDLDKPLPGFYVPRKKVNKEDTKETNLVKLEEEKSLEEVEINSNKNVKDCEAGKESEEEKFESCSGESSDNTESDYDTTESDIDQDRTKDLSAKFSKLNCQSTDFIVQDCNNTEHNVDDILAPVKEYSDSENKYNEYEDDRVTDEENDDSGWITPGNIHNIKKELESAFLEEKPATVACLTMDFAMQNVLKQIGLNVVSLDGRIIKQMRTYVLRCHACYKTTSIMTKVFCPSCGNKTLKKVSVTLDEEGKQQIYINFRRPISKKGRRFSLPTPKGGKHPNTPILCEDQPLPDERPSKLARTKNNPLEDDYIAGYSPFVMRDVNSKSAMLGVRSKDPVKYWMRKNPNEVRRRKK